MMKLQKYILNSLMLCMFLVVNVPAGTDTTHTPQPDDGEDSVSVNTTLSWQAPSNYTPSGYNVYLDSNELAVQYANPASTDLFYKVLNQPSTTFDPNILDCGTTYYWRVDALDGNNTYEGAVWKFTTQEPTGDIDKDGLVNFVDAAILFEQWLNTGSGWSADVDCSLMVDSSDYSIMASEWLLPLIVEDTFDDSNSLANWIVIDEGTINSPSNWSIVSQEQAELAGVYGPGSGAISNRKGSFNYWKDPKSLFWADYQFDVSLRAADDDGIGVIFRYRDEDNYYKFDMDSQKNFRKLFKMYNGIETTIASVSGGYTQGQKMQLSINVTGGQFNIILDGNDVFGSTITDSGIPCGTVGLYNWGNIASYFDDFYVQVTYSKFVLANDDSYQVYQNTTLEVTSDGVLSNDDVLNGSLTANLVTDASHGDLTLNSNGTFTYIPDVNYVGSDSFVYEAVADNQVIDQAAVKIRIQSGTEFTVIILPDTQNYSESYPQIYTCQTQWIVDNKDTLNIAFVLHEGDLTNNNHVAEWDNADASMSVLDGNMPYVISAGNHDMGPYGDSSTRDTSLLNQYFPVSRFDSLPQFGGVFEPSHIENSYHYFTAGGIDWLVLVLEFGPRNQVLDWANTVVASHPNRRVMIVTHCYMYWDDTRVGPSDSDNPHEYDICTGLSDPNDFCNDGEEMWTNFVKLHENISFVFSGHILNDGAGKLVSTGDYGNKVYQLLANYQLRSSGGNGWLRILTFYPEQQKIAVETYSPYLRQYDTDPDQQFEFLNVDLTTP